MNAQRPNFATIDLAAIDGRQQVAWAPATMPFGPCGRGDGDHLIVATVREAASNSPAADSVEPERGTPGHNILKFPEPGPVADAPGIVDAGPPADSEVIIAARMVSLLKNVFRTFAPQDLGRIATACSWFSVPGGSRLFSQGDESDSIYILTSGMLGTYWINPAGGEKLLGRIGAGEIVGEMGFITGERRAATVRALRNCELLRVSRDELRKLSVRYPAVLTELCGTVVRRLRDAQETRGPVPLCPRTICIVPQDAELDARSFAQRLVEATGAAARGLVLSRQEGGGNTAGWFFECERHRNPVVYLAELGAGAWTRFCLRQADCVVLLARGASEARPFDALGPAQADLPPDIPTDLVLLWDQAIVGGKTAAWLDLIKPRAHHHVRSASDGARGARLIAGRSVGLVLSGGGARGLAHLGVVRALREHGIPIDAIGGASMGAIVGAALALEWDLQGMAAKCIDGFLRRRLSDFGIPRASLFPGRKLKRLFDEWFGETNIEETLIRFFCVSTNLSNRSLSVHTSGRLATWIRASAAIPGVFPPVIDEGAVHVDGGVLDNLPTDSMRQFGVGSMIAVNVGMEEGLVAKGRPPGILELLWRVGTIGSDSKVGSEYRRCDVLLTPRVQHIHLLDWRAYEQVIDAGYQATVECLPDLDLIAR
jgi:NTE family protein